MSIWRAGRRQLERQAAGRQLTKAGRRSLRMRERGMKVVPSGDPARALDAATSAWIMFKHEDPLRQ